MTALEPILAQMDTRLDRLERRAGTEVGPEVPVVVVMTVEEKLDRVLRLMARMARVVGVDDEDSDG